MDRLYKMCRVKPTKEGKYELLEKFHYCGVSVPIGYVTNGADIPRALWSIIPPFQPELLPAIVIHDYLCSLGEFGRANYLFRKILKDLNVKLWKRIMLIGGVEGYHFVINGILPFHFKPQ